MLQGEPLVTEDDFETIRRVIAGERNEFRHLVLGHQNMVFSLINRQVANRAIAEELTQETFVKAFKHLESFRFESKFSTWLSRIAINLSNSYFASKRYKQLKKTEEYNAEMHEQSGNNLEERESQKELLSCFQSALAELKPKFREVLTLCGLEGISYEEAAETLEIPVGTVRSRLNKARLLMKEAMREKDSGLFENC